MLPGRRLTPRDIEAALTVARALAASGRRTSFHYGYDDLGRARASAAIRGAGARGLVVIGDARRGRRAPRFAGRDACRTGAGPGHSCCGPDRRDAGASCIRCRRSAGQPLDRQPGDRRDARRRGRHRSATAAAARQASERISFTELGLTPALAEVFGRADISVAIDGAHAACRDQGRRASLSTSWWLRTAPASARW